MKRRKIIWIILFFLLIQNFSFAAKEEIPAGIDESKLKSARMTEGMSVNKPEFDTDKYAKKYKKVTKDGAVMQALELMQSVNIAKYSYNAIMGNNLTEKPVKIEFKNISEINQAYASYDALGWKKKNRLYIYINEKHRNSPPESIAALLAHEAIHQDEYNSLNEETYAWTLEAAVWTQLTEENPALEKISHPLVERENVIKQLFVRGDYTSKYIYKFVVTNKGYQNLPERSYGFEELL